MRSDSLIAEDAAKKGITEKAPSVQEGAYVHLDTQVTLRKMDTLNDFIALLPLQTTKSIVYVAADATINKGIVVGLPPVLSEQHQHIKLGDVVFYSPRSKVQTIQQDDCPIALEIHYLRNLHAVAQIPHNVKITD